MNVRGATVRHAIALLDHHAVSRWALPMLVHDLPDGPMVVAALTCPRGCAVRLGLVGCIGDVLVYREAGQA